MRIPVMDGELSCFRNKNVVIWGSGSAAWNVYFCLRERGIQVYAFCDNDCKKWGIQCWGRKSILSPNHLREVCSKENCVIVIGSSYEDEIREQIISMELVNKYIGYREFMYRFQCLKQREEIKEGNIIKWVAKGWCSRRGYAIWRNINKTISDFKQEMVYLCLPQKTGNFSLNRVLKDANINYCNTWHDPESLVEITNFSKSGKIKILTAVREPISQNISTMFYWLSKEDSFNFYCGFDELWDDGGNLNNLFQRLLVASEYVAGIEGEFDSVFRTITEQNGEIRMIQKFFGVFNHKIVDLYSFPFNKEKGYSIIDSGRYEVFVFQIEKLEQVKNELFQWLGVLPDTMLPRENAGENRLFGDLYKQAKDKIAFSEEYYTKCYNEEYVRHFYSQEDIDCFRRKWETHICKNGEKGK